MTGATFNDTGNGSRSFLAGENSASVTVTAQAGEFVSVSYTALCEASDGTVRESGSSAALTIQVVNGEATPEPSESATPDSEPAPTETPDVEAGQ